MKLNCVNQFFFFFYDTNALWSVTYAVKAFVAKVHTPVMVTVTIPDMLQDCFQSARLWFVERKTNTRQTDTGERLRSLQGSRAYQGGR